MTTRIVAKPGRNHHSRKRGTRQGGVFTRGAQGRAPSLLTTTLREAYAPQGRVDRDKGIVFGVKIAGRTSPNTHGVQGVDGTEYTLDALRNATPLYEGVNVNVDHPPREKPGKERSALERYAWLENVEVRESGMFGDLHFLDPTDALAVRVMNAAEQHPESYALSHNALGRGEVRDGKYIIVEIPEVRSVDLVADGGSCNSLFEHKEVRPMKIKTLFESALPKLKKTAQKRLRKLLEDCHGDDDMKKVMEEEVPAAMAPVADDAAASSDPHEALAAGFRAAILAVVDDDTLNGKAKLAKLKEFIMSHEKLKPDAADETEIVADDDEEEEDLEEGEEDEDEDEEEVRESRQPKKSKYRELQERLDLLEREKAIRAECDAADFRPTPLMNKALTLLTESKERKALIEEYRVSVRQGARPRSQGPGAASANSSTKRVTDSKSFVSAILR